MAKVVKHTACPRCRDNGKDRRGDNLAIYADGGGHCFSCGYHQWPTTFIPPVKVDHHVETVLPSDFTREVPRIAWQWLLQYGLSANYWKPHIGWSEKYMRLVFPNGDFSIGRYLGPPDPKARKWWVWGDDKKRPLVFGENNERVVLVEDLLSAHKVGQVVQAIPLLGTRVWPAVVPILRHLGAPITMWLDQDQEEHARKRATHLSILTGLPVSYVFTKDDPKLLSLDIIREKLND